MVSTTPKLCIFCDQCARIGSQKFSVHICETKHTIVSAYEETCNFWKERKTLFEKWILIKK